ncbi:hypothetical protein HG537_0A07440 [Torulaspora globosa]|uniref:Tyr recombinase Flp-type domain-containing protein n=1 Tax=Torulaspora globosa TaxID=48254 RepID=A0A7H9HPG0_9SACH|nr:hypothetical protein HG537_0A07440 [Torulaspora sp. CBS 2947]
MSLRAALQRPARTKVPTGPVKHEGKAGVSECFKDSMRNVRSLPRDILQPVIESIDGHARKASTKAEYPLLFLATVFNCCRRGDVTNIDPSTFEIVDHEYLGKIVRCLVTDTKTGQPRHVDFYPVAGRYDPIIALHCLLCETKPPKKSFTSSEETPQEYQLLRDALVGTYGRFLKATAPLPVFKIKHGPKSHFGRHLMASYLNKVNLGDCVTALGNWSDRDKKIGNSTAKKIGNSTAKKIGNSTARSKYVYRVAEIPSHLYAFLSGYFKLSQDREGKVLDCSLIDKARVPPVITLSAPDTPDLDEIYHGWADLKKIYHDWVGIINMKSWRSLGDTTW